MMPLEKRPFIFKKPALRFFCPLCRTKRAFTIRPRLTVMHWLQIVMSSLVLVICSAPFMGVYSGIFFFIVWSGMEFSIRLRFRRQIPCPHCGFDAAWYKRDVKIAKKIVKNFWKKEGEGNQASEVHEMPLTQSTSEDLASSL